MAQGLAADTEDTSESQGEQETLQPGPSSSQFPQLSELRETYNALMANAEPPHDDDEEDEISMFIRSGGQIMQDETTCEEQPSIKGSTAKPAAKTKTKTTIPQAEPEASQAKMRSTKQVQLKPKPAPRSKASQAKAMTSSGPKRMPRPLPQPSKAPQDNLSKSSGSKPQSSTGSMMHPHQVRAELMKGELQPSATVIDKLKEEVQEVEPPIEAPAKREVEHRSRKEESRVSDSIEQEAELGESDPEEGSVYETYVVEEEIEEEVQSTKDEVLDDVDSDTEGIGVATMTMAPEEEQPQVPETDIVSIWVETLRMGIDDSIYESIIERVKMRGTAVTHTVYADEVFCIMSTHRQAERVQERCDNVTIQESTIKLRSHDYLSAPRHPHRLSTN